MSNLNILVLGAGGREDALAWKLSQSTTVENVYVYPGNGSQRTAKLPGFSLDLSDSSSFSELAVCCQKNNISLVVPGPEVLLVAGISDSLQSYGIKVFGPSAKAATLEGSKTFSKDFMKRHNIPTAKYENFTSFEKAKDFLEANKDTKWVIKASGIAAGKGVLIPETHEEAVSNLEDVMVKKQFGSAGDSVVIEEFLEGDEISILTLSDGYSYVNLPPAQDHKRIGENDTGLNTGGMGCYAPAPIATASTLKYIDEHIIKPSIKGMRADGFPFVGCLFTGFILTSSGPKVLEYNVRFGDPETETVMPLIEGDFAQVLLAACEHRLDCVELKLKQDVFSTTVILAAGGYPEAYNKGDKIEINGEKLGKSTEIFHAGTTLTSKGDLVTNGGRVIAVTSTGNSIEDSLATVYAAVEQVQFEKKYFRRDIAHRALKQQEIKEAITYAQAGVSVDNGNLLVEKIKAKVKSTQRPGADSDIGGFGGVFDLAAAGYENGKETLLVAATDGVGTKLRIAQDTNIHTTVGIDLVAMNVNDLVVQGAEPLIFLDYFATGKLDIGIAADFVSGVADGCLLAGCALVGGETSEMPGMYDPGHYDTNGTAVGAVKRDKILPRIDAMQEGDVLLGLASDGVHSNGFSLVRRIIEHVGIQWEETCPWDASKTLGEAILVPTRIYVKQLLPSIKEDLLLGLAHITGGGLVENIPRALPKNLQAVVDMNAWELPEVFKWFGKAGNVPVDDILKTFNMGVGMVLIVKPENVERTKELLKQADETVYEIGKLVTKKNESDAGCVVENATGLY
ncbi:hypothetical protein QEN19_000932 [Hanseniaspora menglaensis]